MFDSATGKQPPGLCAMSGSSVVNQLHLRLTLMTSSLRMPGAQDLAKPETTALLLLPKDKHKSGVRQCHGQAVSRFARLATSDITILLSQPGAILAPEIHSLGPRTQNVVMPLTKAVLLLPKDKCENDV